MADAAFNIPLQGAITAASDIGGAPEISVDEPSLREVVEHPKFTALTPVQQKLAVSEMSPGFASLQPGQQDQALQLLLTGIAFKPGENKNTGKLPTPSESQRYGAFAQGALDTALAGVPEAVAVRGTGVNEFDPDSPKFTNPKTYALGQTLGGLIPVSRFKQGANLVKNAAREGYKRAIGAGLKTGAKEGAILGGLYGGVGAASNAAKRPDSTLEEGLKEGATGALIGTGVGAVGGAVLGGIGGAAARLSRRLNPVQTDVLSNILQLPEKDTRGRLDVISGQYAPAIEKIKPFKTQPGAAGAVSATMRAVDKEMQSIRPEVELFPISGFPTVPEIMAIADQKLSKVVNNPATREKLLRVFKSDFENLNPQTLIPSASEKNRLLAAYYENSGALTTPERQLALKAVRDTFSQIIHDILKTTPGGDARYSTVGKMMEIQDKLGTRYVNALSQRASGEAAPIKIGVEQLAKVVYPKAGLKKALQESGEGAIENVRFLDKQADRLFTAENEIDPDVQRYINAVKAAKGARAPRTAPARQAPPMGSPQQQAAMLQWLNANPPPAQPIIVPPRKP